MAYAQICQQEKVGELVDFPTTELDVSPYLVINQGPIIYDLYAVSNHYGSLNGGHYTAYAFNAVSGNWYDFNDSSVSPASEKNVVTAGAYLLFYRKREV